VKRVTRFSIGKESIEDMSKAKRFNRCLEITFHDRTGIHTHKISAGYSDEIHAYREGTITYILSHNHGLGYFGLEVFEGSDKIGDIFIENYQVKETIGRDDLAPFNTIKRMAAYIQ
jgi:hypothetical protein